MLAEWIKSLDKKTTERTDEDLEIIYKKLKTLKLFRRVHPSVIQQFCFVAIIEHIEKGVMLYKQGDEALNWYLLVYGSLDVQITHTGKRKDVVTVCTLGSGTAFGEYVLNDGLHSVSVVSNEPCTLLRVPKQSFRDIWQKSSQFMEEIITPSFSLPDVEPNSKSQPSSKKNSLANDSIDQSQQQQQQSQQSENELLENETKQEFEAKSSNDVIEGFKEIKMSENLVKLMHAGWIIRSMISQTAPHLIRDRKHPSTSEIFDKCFIGSELTDWLINITVSSNRVKVRSRKQAESIYQVLFEKKIIYADEMNSFLDRYAFYRFCFDDVIDERMQTLLNLFQQNIPLDDNRIYDYLYENLTFLLHLAPQATLRQILRKRPENRTEDEIDIVYEEIMNIKAFSHLSNSVKKELSGVIAFESYEQKSTILFKQGDRGTCWYIILKGSVNVVIASKGIVCTLHEGDDFGKLALVNEAPRAATIITNEPDCQFLRVDKVHFDRILKDNEASIVRLKECGKEVLILQKMSIKQLKNEGQPSHFKYMVMAGTPEKVIDYLLETRMNNNNNSEEQFNKENLFEDFLLTFPIFITWKQMTNSLLRHYKIDELNFRQMEDYIIDNKKRVTRFIMLWYRISQDSFLNSQTTGHFLDELIDLLDKDNLKHNNQFEAELNSLKSIKETKEMYNMHLQMRGPIIYNADHSNSVHWMSNFNETFLPKTSNDFKRIFKLKAIKESDETICRVYCADHTYTTLKITMDTKAEIIKNQAAEKLNLDNRMDYSLVELKSDNERYVYNETEYNVATTLSLNGRIFISHKDHLDALTTLPEQEGPTIGSMFKLESFSSQEIAYFLTNSTWDLFTNVHPYEFIYVVFGRHNFKAITSNLDLCRRTFNELQYWAITEVLLEKSLSRRVQILKKLIKIAGYCKEYKNLNAFFAIIIGLSNVAVSRLTQTWEKLHNKVKRIFTQYESLIDSSRNYRRYRLLLAKVDPPYIPFIPLLIKDMTIVHEGNKTFVDQGLVNFEKMHLLAQTLRMIQDCRLGSFQLESPRNLTSIKKMNFTNVLQEYFEQMRVIDNQKRLMQLSYCLEHRKL
ncbi:Kinesin light chain protein [Sarcoptes scabiei]|nr:Kinesin light chain protein [Sarcoptes scabiei]